MHLENGKSFSFFPEVLVSFIIVEWYIKEVERLPRTLARSGPVQVLYLFFRLMMLMKIAVQQTGNALKTRIDNFIKKLWNVFIDKIFIILIFFVCNKLVEFVWNACL